MKKLDCYKCGCVDIVWNDIENCPNCGVILDADDFEEEDK
jgi:predicted  nucleic acid-binding Zn-ribbon protein